MDLSADSLRATLLRAPALEDRHLRAAWIFGSRARGEARPDSDLDLAVLCESSLGFDAARLMDWMSEELPLEVDLVDLRSADPSLVWEIVTSGAAIFEADEEEVTEYVRRARWAAEDWERRNRMILAAQVGHTGGPPR